MTTLKEILRQYGIPYKEPGQHEHARPGWIQIDCPYCSKDQQRFLLGYNIARGYFHCYLCGFHWIAETLRLLTKETNSWALREIVNCVHTNNYELVQPKRGELQLPPGTGPLLKPHRKYLQSRKLDPDEIVDTWGILGTGTTGKLPWRIIIPIKDFLGKTVSWTSRSISKTNPRRYINAKAGEESMSAKYVLYGEHLCQYGIIICEGPVDAWRLGKNAVATLGVGYSQTQLHKMSRHPLRVICFDSEKEAQKRARKLARELSLFNGETMNVVLDSKDPGEATEKEIKQLRELVS